MTDYTLASLTQPAAAPKKSRTALYATLAVVAAVLLVGAAVVVTLLATRPGSTPTRAVAAAAPTTAGTFTVEGYVELTHGQFTWQGTDNPVCSGMNGFDDMTAGAQMTISDATGKALVVGQLDAGRAFDITGDIAGSCRLTFSIPKVPSGVGPYGIKVTHRDAGHYAEADLRGQALELSV